MLKISALCFSIFLNQLCNFSFYEIKCNYSLLTIVVSEEEGKYLPNVQLTFFFCCVCGALSFCRSAYQSPIMGNENSTRAFTNLLPLFREYAN